MDERERMDLHQQHIEKLIARQQRLQDLVADLSKPEESVHGDIPECIDLRCPCQELPTQKLYSEDEKAYWQEVIDELLGDVAAIQREIAVIPQARDVFSEYEMLNSALVAYLRSHPETKERKNGTA